MQYREIELTNGERVRVYAVNIYAVYAAQDMVKLPDVPMQMIKSDLDGHEEPWPNENDATYKRELEAANVQRRRVYRDMCLLYALKDVSVPDGDEWMRLPVRYGVKPRDGEDGRKLDYLEYGLLVTQADMDAVFTVINHLSFADPERIAAIEASFRRNGGGASAPALAAAG